MLDKQKRLNAEMEKLVLDAHPILNEIMEALDRNEWPDTSLINKMIGITDGMSLLNQA